MKVSVNGVVVDTKWLRCMRTSAKTGERCQTFLGEMGIVEVATDDAGNVKFDLTCGTHVNKMAGDDVRFNVRRDALASGLLVNALD